MKDILQKKIFDIAYRANVPIDLLPSINISNDYAKPYIEIQDNYYYYVIRERGEEYERTLYFDIKKLLYRVFDDISFDMAKMINFNSESGEYVFYLLEKKKEIFNNMKSLIG
ncbi:hypothetical protein [Riemerella anatipestifer]|uniref:hypothetical protein n=1 Tax=Riemerella anatipestifer TaxID=34085 RepID=UPI003DA9A3BD